MGNSEESEMGNWIHWKEWAWYQSNHCQWLRICVQLQRAQESVQDAIDVSPVICVLDRNICDNKCNAQNVRQ